MVSTKRSSTNNGPSSNNSSTTPKVVSNEDMTGASLMKAATSSTTSSPSITNPASTSAGGSSKHMESNCSVCSRYKEGERVLCFEPDPTKVRVVYDAKILQISVTMDEKRAKNIHEFLVHFQGWNASWDRFVPQSYLLKVTLIHLCVLILRATDILRLFTFSFNRYIPIISFYRTTKKIENYKKVCSKKQMSCQNLRRRKRRRSRDHHKIYCWKHRLVTLH